MQSSPHELVSRSHISISGDVVIDPSAAIAPGVLLQADPGCRLTIAAGVCIGQGVVLHAHQGQLTIESGAALGSGVLVIGQGQIGANACIGAFTTILNSSIAADQIVPPRSLIGETGRQVSELSEPSAPEPSAPEPIPDPWVAEPAPAVAHPATPPVAPTVTPNFKAGFVSGFSAPSRASSVNGVNGVNGATAPTAPSPASPTSPPTAPFNSAIPDPTHNLMSTPKPPTQVYGQAYVQRIMIAMFPHRRLTEQPTERHDGSTPPNPLP